MKELKKNLIDFSLALWKGEMERYEQVFIAFNTSINDALKVIGIINRNGINWTGTKNMNIEEIKLQFSMECLALTSMTTQESITLFDNLLNSKRYELR